MTHRFFIPLVLGALIFPLTAAAQQKNGQAKHRWVNPHWLGKWELSKTINRAIGFDSEKSREGAVFSDYPTSFELTISPKVGEGMKRETFKSYREFFREKLNHRIVATGLWKTHFGENIDPGIEPNCFVTRNGRALFLWVPVPYAILYGGKISFVQGADAKRDLLIIDFNTFEKNLKGKIRSVDTVVYRRSK